MRWREGYERQAKEVKALGEIFEVKMGLGLELEREGFDGYDGANFGGGEGSDRQRDGLGFVAPGFVMPRPENNPRFVSWDQGEESNKRFEMSDAMFDVRFGDGSLGVSRGWFVGVGVSVRRKDERTV